MFQHAITTFAQKLLSFVGFSATRTRKLICGGLEFLTKSNIFV